MTLPRRRFGRTGLEISLLSLGGMRFQQSWTDLEPEYITTASQERVRHTLEHAIQLGLNHIETARHYGSSEWQIGQAITSLLTGVDHILQTKIPPQENADIFEAELETSIERIGTSRIDLLAIHGINRPDHLDQTLKPGGCLDVARRWQKKGRIGSIGFSTHGPTDLIVAAIDSNAFDYVNLHWYFIRQENEPALAAAHSRDLGVFIISPTDKGGHLHSPSEQLVELCSPLHPIVFNDLFCLQDQRVHTISVGAAKPEDLNLHIEAVARLSEARSILPPIQARLQRAALTALGEPWLKTWNWGLPSWQDTPGCINLPLLLWLHNLIEAWGLEDYARARYRLLGQAGHWLPGVNADVLDVTVSEEQLLVVLKDSPWQRTIPGLLRRLRNRLQGDPSQRLSKT
ncbi:aldo/keto reductase [cyanobiont of Ornithocercus magnificus]|nr:aldo/keto reductase [cyanobiont of Ornithocercus magnificus]